MGLACSKRKSKSKAESVEPPAVVKSVPVEPISDHRPASNEHHEHHAQDQGGQRWPEAYERGQSIIGLFDFPARSDKELSFQVNDVMIIIDLCDENWLHAYHKTSGREGYIPTNFVAHINSLSIYDWYYRDINRRESENLLNEKSEGTFLVRDSQRNPGDYSLSVKHTKGTKVFRHYVIKYLNNMYSIWNMTPFYSIYNLIEAYKINTEGIDILLIYPLQKISPSLCELSYDTKDDWERNRTEFQFEKEIGSGNFGLVHKGTWKGQVAVAIKSLKEEGNMSSEEFLKEATIMKKLKHDNILGLLAVCSLEDPILIVTQFMANGSLLDFLKEHRDDEQTIGLDYMLEAAFQVAKGMSYLEHKNLIHRDLAARNILVDDSFVCKIADFGLSRILQGSDKKAFEAGKFPVKWCPPEVLERGEFSIKSDVWAFGILLIEIFTYGRPLYPGLSQKDIRKQVPLGLRPLQPTLCPVYVYELLVKCWDDNADGRPYFKELEKYFDDSFRQPKDGTIYCAKDNASNARVIKVMH